MPIYINETDNGLGNIIFGYGVVSSQEYYMSTSIHLTKPKKILQKYIYSICDYSKVTHVNLDLKFVYKIAKQSIGISKINPHVIVAIVVSNDITFGIAKIWSELVEDTGWDINILKDRIKAENWTELKIKEKHGITNLTFM